MKSGETGMKIKIGQIFRVTWKTEGDCSEFENYLILTKGNSDKPADINKGIFAFKEVAHTVSRESRVPAIIIHSNPFKEDTENNPWVDIIESDKGFALYNGDNKSSLYTAYQAPGNKKLLECLPLYEDPAKRNNAPPILVFVQKEVEGNRKGYREFSGYGVPVRTYFRTQREKGTDFYFTNIVFEFVLFSLAEENEEFPWGWIDKRRDNRFSAKEILPYAPKEWQYWVKFGSEAYERIRRNVTKYRVAKKIGTVKFHKRRK